MTGFQWTLLFLSPSIVVCLWLAWVVGSETLRDVLDADTPLPSEVVSLDEWRSRA